MEQIFEFVMNNKTSIIGATVIAGRVFQALKNDGGIKGVLSAIWLGTNTPKSTEQPK